MLDLTATIVPKSDQLNADDLIGATKTIKVTSIEKIPNSKDIKVHYEGGEGKPYLPCLTMRRVLIIVWGNDGHSYVGRMMTLYRDEKVLYGGLQVGGIRISHLSHIEKEMSIVLTEKRGG